MFVRIAYWSLYVYTIQTVRVSMLREIWVTSTFPHTRYWACNGVCAYYVLVSVCPSIGTVRASMLRKIEPLHFSSCEILSITPGISLACCVRIRQQRPVLMHISMQVHHTHTHTHSQKTKTNITHTYIYVYVYKFSIKNRFAAARQSHWFSFYCNPLTEHDPIFLLSTK